MKLKDALRRLPTRSIRSGVICLGLLAALGIGQGIASAVRAPLSMTHQPPSSIEPWQDLVLTFSVSGDCEGDPPGASPQGTGITVDKSCGPLSGGVSYDSGTGQNTVAATFAPRDSQGLRAGTVTIPGSGLPSGATLTYIIEAQQSRSSVWSQVGYRQENCLVQTGGRPGICLVYQPTEPYVHGPTESNAISTAYWSATIQISGAPTSPADLTATAGKRKVSLSWTASTDSGGSGLAGYEIWRSTSAAGTFLKIATTASTSYANSGLTRGATYWYYVVAYDRAANRSAPSNTASAKVL